MELELYVALKRAVHHAICFERECSRLSRELGVPCLADDPRNTTMTELKKVLTAFDGKERD